MNKLVISEETSRALRQYDDSYIEAATSENTRRAYQADVNHFLEKGGELPATSEMIIQYLIDCAESKNPRTLTRRVTALRQWHKLQGVNDPTLHPAVIKTLRGIARLHGQPKQQALALRLDDLDKLVGYLNTEDTLYNSRQKALLLVGFFGAFRRSEVVALQWEQIQFVGDGMVITVPRSKTDQVGEGERCVIPYGDDLRCPVRALIAWRQVSKQWSGPVFRRLSKTGEIFDKAITAHHVNRLIQTLVKAAGLPNPEQYSAHSLRRGFATESARLGASMPAIQRHGRWRSTKTVVEYIEAGRQFTDSAVNVLFNFRERDLK